MNQQRKQFLMALTRFTLALLVVSVIMLSATDVLGCPTCKDGIAENDPASAAQAKGYFYSILFMMAMPFLILGTFGSAAYLSIKRAREQQVEATIEGASLEATH